MAFLEYLKENLETQSNELISEELENEGLKDIVKTGAKLIPIFALMFQLFASAPEASPALKNDIKVALIDMQESKSKDELDATSLDVKRMVSTLKGESRDRFMKLFQKAYAETEKKVNRS